MAARRKKSPGKQEKTQQPAKKPASKAAKTSASKAAKKPASKAPKKSASKPAKQAAKKTAKRAAKRAAKKRSGKAATRPARSTVAGRVAAAAGSSPAPVDAPAVSPKIAEIQQILDVMRAAGAVELETEDRAGGRLHLRLKEEHPPGVVTAAMAPQPVVHANLAPAPSAAHAAHPEVDAPVVPAENGEAFVSPMVGTFYRAPSPESEPFASVGDYVQEESTICIIEAMKVMNEIKAEMSGTIVEVLVENGEPVEFGQPLFRISRG